MTTFDFMNLEEAAKRLSIKKVTLLRAISAGELEAARLGNGYKVTEQALQKYVQSRTVNAASTDEAEQGVK